MVGGFVLRPWFDKLDVKGAVSYEACAGCWNTIRLRKDFINQFAQLKEKRVSFSYRMKFYASYDGLKKAVDRTGVVNSYMPYTNNVGFCMG